MSTLQTTNLKNPSSASNNIVLDSSGRVLVNTASGHGTLQVHDGTFVLSKPGGGSDKNWRFLPSDAAAGDLAIQQSTTSGGTTYATKLTIDPSGRVGIGNTDPGTLLTIGGSASSAGKIWLRDTSNNNTLQLTTALSGTYNEIDSQIEFNLRTESGALRFTTNNTERGRWTSDGKFLVGTSTSTGGKLVVENNTGNLFLKQTTGDFGYVLGQNDSDGALTFSRRDTGTVTERMRIMSDGELRVPRAYTNTTVNAANGYVFTDGSIGRSTSSAKYKYEIESIQDSYSDAILQCRPVWYRSTCEKDNSQWGWWGFIAEEVATVDPRLVHWKTTDQVVQENGSIEHVPCDPEPDGVAYDRFVPHLLNLIKRQGEAITELQAEVSALKGA